MPLRTLRFQCRHIFTAGHRCGSPCLKAEEFCFYHHTTLGARLQSRPARSLSPAPGSFALPLPEDRASIQLSIGHILCRVAEGTLDLRTAQVLLYGLQIAANLFPRRRESDQEPARPQYVEEVVDDETLGLLAPAAEYIIPPEARTSNDICDDLLRELRELPDADFYTDPTPAILHNLKASSNPTSTGIPEVHLNSRPKSHPTKTLRPKYQGPHPNLHDQPARFRILPLQACSRECSGLRRRSKYAGSTPSPQAYPLHRASPHPWRSRGSWRELR
jgi:hypothetical protein